jgi:hypothetical protein
MLKIAVAVCVDPMAMQLRPMLKRTTNQTALTGVWVYLLILDRKLTIVSVSVMLLCDERGKRTGCVTRRTVVPRHGQRRMPSAYLPAWPSSR